MFLPKHSAAALAAVWLFSAHSSTLAQSNVNDAFVANELGAGAIQFPGPEGGTISLGYNLDPSMPAGFLQTGLIHTDAFNGSPNVEGYFVQNNALVPALLVNTSPAVNPTNFGTVLQPSEILLHPGNPGPNAFTQPASAAVLRYIIPSTGDYTISGAFTDVGAGGIVAVDVLRNGTTILTAGAGGDTLVFNETDPFTAGDFLDFVVDDAGDIGADSTGFRANIVLVPEPSAFAGLAIGVVGLASRRRR